MDDWGDPWADAINNPKHNEPLNSVAATNKDSNSTSTPVLGGFFESESVWDTTKEADAWANASRDEPVTVDLVAAEKVGGQEEKPDKTPEDSVIADVEDSGALQPSVWDQPKNAAEETTDALPAETPSTDFTPPPEGEEESGTATPSPAKPSPLGVDPSDSESTVRPGSAGTAASEAVPGEDAQARQSQDLESRASTRRSASPSDDSHDEESSESRTSFEDDNRVHGAAKAEEIPETGHHQEDTEVAEAQETANAEVVENEAEEDDFGDFGDFEDEFEQAPEDPKPNSTDASPTDQAVAPPPAAASRQSVADLARKVSLVPDLSLIDKLFPIQVKVDKGEEIPHSPVASTSARKSWYRVTRSETLRKFENGNDVNNYVRVGWQESATRAEVTKIVARWTTEDRINGRTLLGGKPGAVFGWDYPVSPASTELSHKRNASASTPKQTIFDAEVKQRPQSLQVPPLTKPFASSPISGAAFGWNSSQTSLSAPPSKTSFEQQEKRESLERHGDLLGSLNWGSTESAASAPPHKASFEKEMDDDSSLMGGSMSGWNALKSSPPASISKPSFESKETAEKPAPEADSSLNWGLPKSSTMPTVTVEKKEEPKPATRKSPFGWKLPQRTSSAPPPKAVTPKQDAPENPWASSPPSPRPEATPVAEPAPIPDFAQMKKKGKRLSSLAQGNASILLSPSPPPPEPPVTPKPQRPGHFRRISLGFLPKSKKDKVTAHKRSASSTIIPTVARVQTEPTRTAMDNPWDATVAQDWSKDEIVPEPEPEAENPWTQIPSTDKTEKNEGPNPWTEHTPWASVEDLSKTEQSDAPAKQKPDLSINVDEPAEPEYDDWVNSPVSSPGLKGAEEDPWKDFSKKQEPNSSLPLDSATSAPPTITETKPNAAMPALDTTVGDNEEDDWGDMESAAVVSPSLAIPEPSSNPWQPTRNIPPLSIPPTPQTRRSQPVSPLVPESMRATAVSSPAGNRGSWYSKTATTTTSSTIAPPPLTLPQGPLNPFKSSSPPTDSVEFSIPKPSPTQPRIYPQSATTATSMEDPWASADFSIFEKPSTAAANNNTASSKGAAHTHARTASTPHPPKPVTFDAILQPSRTRASPNGNATTFDQILSPSTDTLELEEAEREKQNRSAFGVQPRKLEEYEEFDASPAVMPALDVGWGGDEWRGEAEEGDVGDAVVRRFVGGLPDYGYMLR
ncbi:hypothetical protein HDK77DRAFT_278776 [Phyllosticta capitalensis]